MQIVTVSTAKALRMRQRKAVVVALAAAVVAAVLASVAVTMWNKPRVWVPILAGVAVGILAYALAAPES